MFERCKKIYKKILQTKKHYPKDISYRGQGLSNEYRPMVARGLIGAFEKRHAKKLLNILKKQIQA